MARQAHEVGRGKVALWRPGITDEAHATGRAAGGALERRAQPLLVRSDEREPALGMLGCDGCEGARQVEHALVASDTSEVQGYEIGGIDAELLAYLGACLGIGLEALGVHAGD